MKPLATAILACWITLAPAVGAAPTIILAPGASAQEQLAAREVRRYVFLRTGHPLSLATAETIPFGGAIIVTTKDRVLASKALTDPAGLAVLRGLGPEEFWIKTTRAGGRPILLLAGGDATGALYAAYRFAEHLGVRFYLHGDVVPDDRMSSSLPVLDERSAPLFALRGIQPFHDFPEGPDWWNDAEYGGIIAQLPKLRMNFFALHTYPENAPNAEPTVWIGSKGEFQRDGTVTASYPASYMNTLRGNWGYAPKKTSDYLFGASQLFECDAYGPDVMLGHCPQPESAGACNAVVNTTATMLRRAFTLAHQVGVQTCVGTETPLTVPKQVQERLKAAGKNPADPKVLQELYEAMFARIEAAYPLDYYWFWTPEAWTWEGTKPAQVRRTIDDLFAAIRAHTQVAPPFQLATCGWVLGPQQDRALFDKILPKTMAVSCINREVGKTSVDRGFREVGGRGKWAIPWLEDDPALTAPQLWVGRMRRDAADARRYGCDGLLGIHWRTRILGPNVSALAQAGWTQKPWNPNPLVETEPPREEGAVGGTAVNFPDHPIVDTDEDPVYQAVRYGLDAYRLPLTNSTYTVTLKFCEPHHAAPGKRVFQVHLQGQRVAERLDIFERVGQNHPLDLTFTNVLVRNGWLDVEFLPIIEFPAIAGIVVEGSGVNRRINCGGPAWQGYEAEKVTRRPGQQFPPVADFFADWATQEFGPQVGPLAGQIFAAIDGKLPRPSDWVDGPGGIRPDPRPWANVAPEYRFVSQLESLAPAVRGTGNRSRFDYWVETFRYLRSMGQVNCAWAEFNRALAKAKAGSDPAARQRLARELAVPARRELVRLVSELYQHLFATLSTTGELGTVMNWEQHNLPSLLAKPGEELAGLLGEPLPAGTLPPPAYRGPTRVIVPGVRTSVNQQEPLSLRIIVLAEQPPAEVWLRWRRLGGDSFAPVPATHVARGVYSATLPDKATFDDLEWYIRVVDADGHEVRYPATAPALNQSVVVMTAN